MATMSGVKNASADVPKPLVPTSADAAAFRKDLRSITPPLRLATCKIGNRQSSMLPSLDVIEPLSRDSQSDDGVADTSA